MSHFLYQASLTAYLILLWLESAPTVEVAGFVIRKLVYGLAVRSPHPHLPVQCIAKYHMWVSQQSACCQHCLLDNLQCPFRR